MVIGTVILTLCIVVYTDSFKLHLDANEIRWYNCKMPNKNLLLAITSNRLTFKKY